MEAIQQPNTSREANAATEPPGQEQQPSAANVSREAHEPRTKNASLVADEHQSRGVNGWEADVHPSTVNPPCPPAAAEEGLMEHDSLTQEGLVDSSVAFDPTAVAPNDDFRFDTHEVITNLEKHFRLSLDKDVRNSMHKTHPLPRTPVMRVPKVDRFMMDHLKHRYPKSRDAELGTIQAALLSAAGPLTCLWSDLLDNNLLANEAAVVNVHDVLNIVQCTFVLMGNANELNIPGSTL